MASATNLMEAINEDPDWVDYLNPSQQKVLSDLKKQQQEFDVQYQEWQQELETWRRANANHSDPKSYQDYAQRWEEWKNKLLAQKDQMQRLYQMTLIQLKSQAMKQKEQHRQNNQNTNQMPTQFQNYSVASDQQTTFSQPPHLYNQYQPFNRPMAMNSPFLVRHRPPAGVVPYQTRFAPPPPGIPPQHIYPGSMPVHMMPQNASMVPPQANQPLVQHMVPQLAQTNSGPYGMPFAANGYNSQPWGMNPHLQASIAYPHLVATLPPPPPPPPPPLPPPPQQSESTNASKDEPSPLKNQSSKGDNDSSSRDSNKIDDIVKRASQLIPGLGAYLDDDDLDKSPQSKPTIDLTDDTESTDNKKMSPKVNDLPKKADVDSSKRDAIIEKGNLKENLLSGNRQNNESLNSEMAKCYSAHREFDLIEKEKAKKLNFSESDSEDDIQIEKVLGDNNKSFDLAGVINRMQSIKSANQVQKSESIKNPQINTNSTSNSNQHQATQNQRPFQTLEKINTEGLTTIIEKVDGTPEPINPMPDPDQRGELDRRYQENFHKQSEGPVGGWPRQPYVAKTIDYGHGSPSTAGPHSNDSLRMMNRFHLQPPVLRGLPQHFDSISTGPRGAMRQPPPFNRIPPPTIRGANFNPNRPPPPPPPGVRPFLNERPPFRPQISGGQLPRHPIPAQRHALFNSMYPSSRFSSPQKPPPQQPVLPVKQLTYKDAEYFTAPPSKMVSLYEILYPPARDFRPSKIVIILRGLPGSGKTHLAKLIRDKEAEICGSAPRILSIDDYFMVEKEVVITDENGKQAKAKEFVYEYEEAMEESYRASLLKAFTKTADAPYFKFIIVDAINSSVSHFQQFHSHASSKGFTVYICDMKTQDPETCVKMNVHNRTLEDIKKLTVKWDKTPNDLIKLETKSFLRKIQLEEEIVNSDPPDPSIIEKRRNSDSHEDEIIKKKLASGVNPSRDELESNDKSTKSRWEKVEESSEVDHDRLDGFKVKRKITMDEYLQLPDDYDERNRQSNRKRVRWADVEERKNQQKMRNLGFVVGQNWERVLDPANPERALNKTKYI